MCGLLAPETRQWLDIGAEYLTSIGTVGAVIVALYLSLKDRSEKMSVSAAIHYFVPRDQIRPEAIRLFGLTATNVGFATLTVQNMCWSVGRFRKRVLYVDPPDGFDWPTEKPPKTLQRGDWLTVQMREERFINGLTAVLEEVDRHRFPRLALRSVRAGVETSTKKRFFVKPNWDLAKVICEQFDTFRKSRRSTK
jgi:hypothetical protein